MGIATCVRLSFLELCPPAIFSILSEIHINPCTLDQLLEETQFRLQFDKPVFSFDGDAL